MHASAASTTPQTRIAHPNTYRERGEPSPLGRAALLTDPGVQKAYLGV